MRPVRVLALVPKPRGISPGQRFRIEQWEPLLRERHGVEITWAPFESPALTETLYQPGQRARKAGLVLADFLRRRTEVWNARRYDLAFIYREASLIGPAIWERALAGLGVPYVFDFDDAIWQVDPGGANGLLAHLHFSGKTATLARLAGAVTVGNRYLAEWTRAHTDRVVVAPTSIELRRFPVQPRPPADQPFTVVWTGSHTTLKYLDLVKAPLARLAKDGPVRLRVIANEPWKGAPPEIETTFTPWRAATECEDLAPAHVGIMPLTDDPFSRGKCAAKALQYMAAGIPAIVSPVGVNVDIVRHGENGWIARTDDDWLEAFRAAAGDTRRLREAGRATVEAGFSSDVAAERMWDAMKLALG